MQTAGNLVAATAELAAGVQDRVDRFYGWTASLLFDVDRDPASVVLHGHAVVRVDRDFNFGGKAGQAFVDPVVDDFPDQMVQALGAGRADVHAGTLADGFQATEHLNLAGIVLVGFFFEFFCFCFG